MYVTQGTGSAKGTVLGLQGPHSHILLTGEGKGGGRDFFGSGKILTKRDFLGSMNDVGFFLVAKKNPKKKQGFFLKILDCTSTKRFG